MTTILRRLPLTLLAVCSLIPGLAEAQGSSGSAGVDPETGFVHSRRLHSGVPLGGIGTGTFQILTDGTFSRATLTNNWNQPTGDLDGSFAAIWTRTPNATGARTLALHSPYGLPTVSTLDYEGLYPKATMVYSDPALPVVMTLNAFSPLIPGDLRNSSYPASAFLMRIRNRTMNSVEVSVALSWENILGVGGSAWSGPVQDRTGDRVETLPSAEGYFGLRFTGPSRAVSSAPKERWRENTSGDMTLLALPPGPLAVVTTAGWNALDKRPAWWDHFARSGDVTGQVLPGQQGVIHPAGVVAVRLTLKPNEFVEIPMAVAWNTPHAYTASGVDEGHSYQNLFADSNAAAHGILSEWRSLLALTEEWQERLLFSNLPRWLARRLINCASVLTTHTVYTRDRRFAFLNDVGMSPSASAEEAARYDSYQSLPNGLATSTLLLSFFPQLAAQELREYGAIQTQDGWLPAPGAYHTGLAPVMATPPGSKASSQAYAPTVRDVDAACAYVVQMALYNDWTGDGPFMVRRFRHARRAMEAILDRCDSDGLPLLPASPEPIRSLLPGGSREGSSPTTAFLWLQALHAAHRLAETTADRAFRISQESDTSEDASDSGPNWLDAVREREADRAFAERCAAGYRLAAAGIEKRFWNGKYYTEGAVGAPYSPNALIGVWAGTLLGEELLPNAEHIQEAVRNLSGEQKNLPDTSVGVVAMSRPAQVSLAALTLAEGGLDFRVGLPEAGLALLQSLDVYRNEILQSPWESPLELSFAPHSGPTRGLTSVTGAADWNIQMAIAGVALDVNTGHLALTPKLPGPWRSLRVPLFFSTFWGRLEFKPLAHGYVLTMLLDRVIPYAPQPNLKVGGSAVLTLSVLRVPGPLAGTLSAGDPVVHVSRGRNPLGGHLMREVNGDLSFALDTPLNLQAGDRLEVELDD